ncbi:MAG: calcium-binding protein [Arcobacteraceae bacterium]|nr:calcium-binding protein [Arcobacteraceae bacterium]
MAALTLAVADKAHTLGTSGDLINAGATLTGGPATFLSTDKLTVTGLTKYDTLSLATATATLGNVQLVGSDIQYYDGTSWLKIGAFDGGDGRDLTISFTSTNIQVTDVMVQKLIQSLTISADTSGTIADPRTLTFTLTGSNTATDTVAYTIAGTTGADTIIYSTNAATLTWTDGNAGDGDILKVLVDQTVTGNAIDIGATAYDVLNASEYNNDLEVTIGANNTAITTGTGNDTIKVADAAFLDATVNGGTGVDTLEFTAIANVAAGFGTVSNVEKLKLGDFANVVTLAASDSFKEITGGTAIDTIDASARTVTGATTGNFDLKITTGAGADIVTISQGKDNIDLGADDNELIIKQASDLTAEDVITAAGAADKITLDNAITSMTDVQFTGVTGFEELVGGTGILTLTLGDQVKEAGIKKVDVSTSAAAATVDMVGMTADIAGMTVLGSAAGITIKTRAEDIGATDVFTGGAGTADKLQVATSGTITDAELAGVTLIETLEITSTSGDVTVTIADSNNFTTVSSTTSTGNNTIDVSLEASAIAVNSGSGNDIITTGAGAATVNAGDGNNTITLGAAVNSVTAGSGNDTVNLVAGGTDTLHLGAGENQAIVAYADFTLADTMDGAGTNTLKFTDATTDDGTANTVESKMAVGGTNNKIDIIKLGADATQIVTLGANAKASGVIEVDGSALLTGHDLTVDLTAMDPTSGTFTVIGGAGDDIVKINSASLTATTSLQMGAADTVDVLEIADVATIIDSDFTLSSGLEKLTFKIDGAHNITLGDKAIAAGIETIDTSVTASDGTTAQLIASTIDLSTATIDADFTVLTGKGNDIIKMKAEHLTATDVITAGLGSDTIEFIGASNLTDGAFVGVTEVEKLKLGIGNNQSLIYGTNMQTAGIGLIDGSLVGAGNSVSVDLSAATVAIDLVLSSGNDTVIMGDSALNINLGNGNNTVQTDSAYLTSGDKIVGGTGTDILEVTDAATIIDLDFNQITNFEKLVLANGANSVELGAKAKAAGVVTIDGSVSASSLTATVTDTGFNITGGSGNDTVKIDSAKLSSLTFDGGAGTDTIELTTAASFANDSSFAHLSNIETLLLKDFNTDQSITLGSSTATADNATNSGLNKIDGGALSGVNNITVDISGMLKNMTVNTAGGADVITMGRGVDTISTGLGDDIIKVSSENFTSADTINGGGQTGANGSLGDTLEITTTTNAITDLLFDNVSGIEIVKLSSTSGTYDITLGQTHAYANGIREVSIADGVSANINLSSITGGAIKITKIGTTGDVTVTTSTADQTDNFVFGSGADTVKILTANLTNADTYTFGAGADTLELTDAATVIDADFQNITGVETVKVGNFANNSITIGDTASTTGGVTTVDLSGVTTNTNAQTVDLSTMLNNVGFTVTGGAGVDTIKMKAEDLTTADHLTGGGSTDILQFTTLAVGKTDTDFTNVTGMETLKLVAGGTGDTQSLSLGTQAFDGGNGLKTIDGSAVAGKLTVDLTDASNVTITGGAAGTATTEVTMDATYLTALDTITGGSGALDKIIFDTVATTVGASAFTGVSAMEILEMQGTAGTQSVILGGSGITTIDAHTATGDVTIDGAITTGINLSKVTTGSGADTLKIEAGDLDAGDIFTLGSGINTLEITTDATNTITDSDFANKTGINTLKLSKDVTGQTVTLANSAITAGVNKVDLTSLTSASSSTVDLSTMTTENVNFTVLGGSGADTIKMVAAQLASTDVLTGNGGTDTLEFTTIADGMIDTQFTGVTGIDTLKLAALGGQSITLGTKALEVGNIRTIDGSNLTGINTITISDTATNHGLTITTGSGADTIVMKAEDLTSSDTINGNGGTDTLSLSANGADTTIGVAAFTNVSNVEILKLQENGSFTQNVTLGGGFTTVDASVATDDVTIDGYTTTALNLASVTTGTGADTLKIEAADLDASDVFAMGTGTDTLQIMTDAGSLITDAKFTNKTEIDTLKVGNFTGQTLDIGDKAVTAGIKTIDLTGITSSGNSSTVDMSTNMNLAKDMIVLGGAGADTIQMKTEHLTLSDTLTGNGGDDVLELTTVATNVTDAQFTEVTGIETLKLGNFTNQSLTLGNEALGGGIRIVNATALDSTNGVSIDMSGATNDYAMTINTGTGTGADTVKMKAEHLTSADTIALGNGTTDKLTLTTATGTLGASSFGNITGVEVLELTATTGAQNITLAGDFTTVDAHTTGTAITIDGATTVALDLSNVTTGTGNDTLKLQNADFTSTDVFDFGSGDDTLQIVDAATITDAQFTSVDGLENVTMLANATGQTVTLGDLSVAAGLTKVDFQAITNTTFGVTVHLDDITSDSTSKIIAGAGADNIIMNASHLTIADTLTGGGNGSGVDTLTLVGAATLLDADFTNVSGIEKLVLADADGQTLQLGDEALGGGITTVDGSALLLHTVAIDMSGASLNNDVTITTGTGADTITMLAAHLTSADTLNGGTGVAVDTLAFTDAANLTADKFDHVTNMEKITLQATTGAQDIALVSGFNTVDASVATDSVTIDASLNGTTNLTITTGTNDDTVKIAASTLDTNDVINGGGSGDTDTLEVIGAGNTASGNSITDAKIAHVTNVEVIKLTSTSDAVNVTLGSDASTNGINKIDASATASVNTIDLSAMTTNVEVTGGTGSDIITASSGDNVINAGYGNDTVTINAGNLDASDIIDGGDGIDELILTGLTTDTATFAGITGFESIKLADGVTQEIILGAAEDLNNLLKVDATNVTTGHAITVDITGYEIVTDVDNFTYVGGAGDDTFKMQSTHLTKDDVLSGGAGTSDILEFTDVAINSSSIDIFNNVSGFETLKLADVASDQLVTLKDGVFTTVTGAGNVSTNVLTVNAGNVTGNIEIITAGGADVITAAKGINTINSGAGNDTIKFNIATFLADDVINGGDSTDTIEFIDTSVTLTDAAFAGGNKTNIEKIKLSVNEAGQSITLGGNATTAGINEIDTMTVLQTVTVDAGSLGNALTINTNSGNDIITGGTGVNTINSGSGNDTIKIAAATLTSVDTIDGDAGTLDTLELTGATTLDDSAFTAISNVEILKLANVTGQTLVLGTEAFGAGFKTIDSSNLATNNTASINLVGFTQDTKIIGGAGDETVTMVASTLNGSDDIDLGAGDDTIIFTDVLSTPNLSKLKGVETIQLADGNNQTITLVDTINSSLTIDATALIDVNKVTVDGSALGTATTTFIVNSSTGADEITLGGSTNTVDADGGDDIVNITMAHLSDANVDTIDGGTGTNTLKLTAGGTATDANLEFITNIAEVTLTGATTDYALTLGTNAGNNNIININGSALTTGKVSIDASALGSENVTFKGGDANDTFIIAASQLDLSDTINGKSTTDVDTLTIKGDGTADTTIINTDFTNITNMEKLTYGESAKHTLTAGDKFKDSGIKIIDASIVASNKTFEFNASTMTADVAFDITGGAGIDTITMNGTHLTSSDVLKLGTGANVLQLSGTATGADKITDADFAATSTGVETIKFTENLAQDITVGVNAVDGGLKTIDASGLGSATATINTSAVSSNMTITTGGGNDTITIGGGNVTVTAGNGDDIINTTYANLTKDDSINGGGQNTKDILNISDSANGLSDVTFTNISNMEKLTLTATTAQTITLGDKFKAASFDTIDASLVSSGVTVDLSSMTTDGNFTITGGASNDTIKMLGSHITSGDRIDLGAGTTDTMEISSLSQSTTNITDASFTNILGVDILKFTNYSNSVEFGDTMQVAGVKTIDGSMNSSYGYGLTINMTNMSTSNTTAIGGYTLKGGAGDDYFKLRADQISSSDTINGGSNGTSVGDTLEFVNSVIFTDATKFTGVSNIDKILLGNFAGQQIVLRDGLTSVLDAHTLSSTNGITVGGATLTTAINIKTGAGDDIITLGSGADTATLGAGDDTLTIVTNNIDGNDTIDFGDGTDNLILTTAADLIDSDFAKISNLETITLGNFANSLTLADYAKASGLTKIDNSLSGSATTIDMSSMSSNIGLNYLGGTGADTIKMVGTQFDSDDTIDGGSGTDILWLTNSSYIGDSAFTNVKSVETLKLGSGVHNVTLGALAEAAGITTIDTSAITTEALTIDLTGTSGNITITGHDGADIITIGQGNNTINAGLGDDTIKAVVANLTTADVIDGQGGTNDSLVLTTAINETTTAKFTQVTNVENLVLGNFNNQELTLAVTNNFTKVDGSKLTGTNNVKVNASAVTSDLNVVTSGGNDTIMLGDTATSKATISAGNGDDIIQFTSSSVITSANDVVDGGLGNDTLQFTSTSAASTIIDTWFGTHITGIETIKFGNITGNSITYGAKAATSGIRTIDTTSVATTLTSTIDLSAAAYDMTVNGGAGIDLVKAGTKIDTLNLGAGEDKVTFATSTLLTSADTINGGDDSDTIVMTATTTIADVAFTNITNVEKLQLLGTGAKTVTIGTFAKNSGLNEIDASTTDGTTIGTAVVTIDGQGFSGNISIKTGNAADVITIGSGNVTIDSKDGNDLIKVEGSTFDTSDSIDAGAGTDTVQFIDAVHLTNDMIGQITNAEIIKFSDGSNQSAEIGENTVTKNILKYDASLITTGKSISMDLSSMTTDKDMTLIGGQGDDTFTFKKAQFTANDVVTAGSGIDKVVFVDEVSGAGFDDLFANKTALETIALSNGFNHTLTLGAKAQTAGVNQIDATALNDAFSINVDASAYTKTLSVVSNGGADVIVAGSGLDSYVLGNGDDKITFKSGYLVKDIVHGGNGADTIYISDLAKITDVSLENVESFEKMVLSNTAGATSIVFGANAQAGGLVELDGSAMGTIGTGSTSTIDISAMSVDFTLKTGAGIDKIVLGGGDVTVESGTGADEITITAANLTLDDRINGGGDSDKLIISTSASGTSAIIDADFTNITSVETLVLSKFDGQKVTIGTLAKNAGINTIDAKLLSSASNNLEIDATSLNTANFTITSGSGYDMIKLGTANDTVDAGSGDDTIVFRNTDFTVGDTIIGNGGIDTILISDAATIIDEDFTNVTTVETLKLSDFDSQTVTLGAKASLAVLKELDATALTGTNAVTVDVGSVTSTFSVKGGAGDDTFKITSEKLTTKLSIDGGGNVALDSTHFGDKVIIEDKATVTDDKFTYFKNIETITLSDFIGQSLVLGAKASTIGLKNIDASALTVNNGVTIDMKDLVADVALTGGAGSDTVTISMANTTSADSIDLGDGANDTLIIADAINAATTGGTFESWLLAGNGSGLSGIETLKLLNTSGGQTLTLGATAKTLGLNKVDLTAVTASSGVVVDATLLDTALTLTATSGNHTITTATGAYNDNITSGSGINTIILDGGDDTVDAGSGEDTIQIASANLTSADSIDGGIGVKDTLLVSNIAASNMTDDQFTNVKNLEVVKLATNQAGQKITLGSFAKTAGINTVDGTALNTTNGFEINAATFAGNLTVLGGAWDDTFTGGQGNDIANMGAGNDILQYSTLYLNSSDTLDGGAGTDTLIITDTANLTDVQFTKLSSIETLKLGTNASNQTIVLGANAAKSGITTLDLRGIDGANYTVNTSAFTKDLEILVDRAGGKFITSSKNDTVTIEADMFTEFLDYTGGLGIDTIKISTPATTAIVDLDFTKLVGVEVLSLSSGGTVNLGTKAILAGITTVDLSSSNTASTIVATDFAKSLNITLGQGATEIITTHQSVYVNDFVSTTSANLGALDTINLGTGNSDTIIITDEAHLTSTQLSANLTNIEILKLGTVGNHDVNFSGSASSISMLDGTLMTAAQSSIINVTSKTEAIEVKMGAGADTIVMSLADLAKYSVVGTGAGTAESQKVIDGGAGIDTLMISTAGATITDTMFDDPNLTLLGTVKLTGIEAIGLAHGGSITLGKNASVEGITTVDVSGSDDASTILTTAVTKNITVNLGNQVDSVTTGGKNDTVNVAAANLTGGDTIALGAGTDTLNITTAINYANIANFAGITNVEILKLSSDTAGQAVVLTGTSFIELDAKAMKTGNVTVDATGIVDRITITLGSGDDTVKMDATDLVNVDMKAINGGSGTDILNITGTATLVDTDFTTRKISGFETIKLTGSLVAETNFNATGISKVIADTAGLTFNSSILTKNFDVTGSVATDTITLGKGADIIRGIDGDDVIIAGLGNDTFYFEGDKLDASDKVDGGDADALTLGNDGVDTIIFNSTIGTFADANMTQVVSIETLKFGNYAGQTYTYGDKTTAAGVTTLDASLAASGFTLDSSSLTSDVTFSFIGGAGVDTVKTKMAYLTLTDTIDGAGGNDILQISDAGTLNDAQFTGVKNVETLKLADGANILNLGSKFSNSGILTIDASLVTTNTNTNTIDMSIVTTKAYSIIGGAGDDTIKMKSVLANSGITLQAGGQAAAGADILEITDKAIIADAAFTNFTSLETIKVSNYAGNSIVLGEKARLAGVVEVDGSAMTTGTIDVDMTTMTTDIDVTLNGGAKNDTFKFNIDQLTATDTINGGGTTDVDTIVISGTGALTDADFTLVTNVEKLSFVAGSDYTVTLNSSSTTLAQTAGIVTVDAVTLGSGDVLTLDASYYTVGLTVTSGAGDDIITTGSGDDKVVAGDGNDIITSGSGVDNLSGGNGDDTFVFTFANLTSADKIAGDNGTDTMQFTDAVTFNTAYGEFYNKTGIEKLQLDGGGEATMNIYMVNAGVREIDGSLSGATEHLTINGSYASNSQNLTLKGGAGDDKIYAGKGTDTLTGGAGADTFIFSGVLKANGTNTITDFTDETDKISLSFATGSLDYADAARVDGTQLTFSDFNNYVEDVTYDKYDTDNNGSLDGDYALITLTGGDTISLLGVASGITQADFVYQLV